MIKRRIDELDVGKTWISLIWWLAVIRQVMYILSILISRKASLRLKKKSGILYLRSSSNPRLHSTWCWVKLSGDRFRESTWVSAGAPDEWMPWCSLSHLSLTVFRIGAVHLSLIFFLFFGSTLSRLRTVRDGLDHDRVSKDSQSAWGPAIKTLALAHPFPLLTLTLSLCHTLHSAFSGLILFIHKTIRLTNILSPCYSLYPTCLLSSFQLLP